MREAFVYILTNLGNQILYTGVTNDLYRRVLEHRAGKTPAFTARYKLNKLVYFEAGDSIIAAIDREKQIKSGSRKKKIELIEALNPTWKDLFSELFE